MLNENLKLLRREKGYSQEELAIRLNVVRQTISKWEKGLSVPDADMLVRIAEIFEVPVNELLGTRPKDAALQANEIAEQLARVNEQLAVKNRRARRIWRVVGWTLAGVLVVNLVLIILGFAAYERHAVDGGTVVEVCEEEAVAIPED